VAAASEPHSFPVGGLAENMTVRVGQISVTLGILKGVTCSPLFLTKANFKLQAHDWSSSPNMTGEYYCIFFMPGDN